MADFDFHPNPFTPLPSTPLQLSGFLTGETIQVQGDTGDLQFSVQFNIRKKNPPSPANFPQNFTFSPEDDDSCRSYMTPIAPHEVEDPNGNIDDCGTRQKEGILTRLRSGVISPVEYFPKHVRSRRKYDSRIRKKDLLERLLRRRSLPVKPCGSYSFFVMATWGSVKGSSFAETSKRLSRTWCKLGQTEKKMFEELALKDSARYKRQSMLLMGERQGKLMENWKMVKEGKNEVSSMDRT